MCLGILAGTFDVVYVQVFCMRIVCPGKCILYSFLPPTYAKIRYWAMQVHLMKGVISDTLQVLCSYVVSCLSTCIVIHHVLLRQQAGIF